MRKKGHFVKDREIIKRGDDMIYYQQIAAALSRVLSAKRYRHSMSVCECAQQLAQRYGIDQERAGLAGILHDCARDISDDRLLQMAGEFGIIVNDIEKYEPVLLHADVGAKLCVAEYGICDGEIERAIKLHTTGGPGMTLLEKVIYLADCIEPGRDFPGVKKLRKLAEADLDKAILAAYDQSIEYLLTKSSLIHPRTIEGRNELLAKVLAIHK